MKKIFAAFVAVANDCQFLAATPQAHSVASPQGVAAPGRYYEPGPLTEQVAGHTTILAVRNGWQQRFYDGHGWRSAGCESAAVRDYGEIEGHRNHRVRAEPSK